MMKANVGGADRVIRVILGIALLGLGVFVLGGAWKWVSVVLGVVLLLTGLVSFCLLYTLFNINTAKTTGESTADTGTT